MATFLYPAVSVTTLPPVGGATSANQLLEIAQLEDINANTAGPVKIRKNGTIQEVNKDSGTPANTVAIPVEIVSASGTTINITAGDINIQTTSEGSSFDSMRIGNGTGVYWGINGSNEGLVRDAGAITAIGLLAKLTDTQPVSLASQPLPTGASTEAKQDTQITRLNLLSTEAKQDTQITRLNLLATNADLLLMSAKLPASLGQKAMAASMAVTIASDQSVIPVTQAAPSVVSTDDSNAAIDHTTGAAFTKPVGAKNMVIFNNAGDPIANRVRIGQAPNWGTSVGAILGVGSSTALLPASSFRALAENASSLANVTVIWFY